LPTGENHLIWIEVYVVYSARTGECELITPATGCSAVFCSAAASSGTSLEYLRLVNHKLIGGSGVQYDGNQENQNIHLVEERQP